MLQSDKDTILRESLTGMRMYFNWFMAHYHYHHHKNSQLNQLKPHLLTGSCEGECIVLHILLETGSTIRPKNQKSRFCFSLLKKKSGKKGAF